MDLENTVLASVKEVNKLWKLILGASTIDEILKLWYSRVQIDFAFRESMHLTYYEFNWVKYKRCWFCRDTKESTHFGANKSNKHWLKSYCKECEAVKTKNKKLIDKEWAEKERIRKLEYKKLHKEKVLEKERERYANKMKNLTIEEKYKLRLRWTKANKKRAK